ncbi:thiopeptide-type bacteriocin biosynthesis protein [Amycolatopsis anabasis]|uniref:thiopeptide-type bacteriocin biosynthesis protein n=1 Tax=Amycolatopsis anabasis TaxID=1840409 RepID=UPI00131B5547|nr:thiopeptide-type bacteriocin biosynthesis protein [Amycolatopsis anabasis]
MPSPSSVPECASAVSLAEFLYGCAGTLLGDGGVGGLDEAQRTFLNAGVAALLARDGEWVQADLAMTELEAPLVYPRIRGLVCEWLDQGDVSEFFFMHKPPGLRIRFAPASGRADWVRGEFQRRAGEWGDAGLTRGVRSAVYEPESQLFGGPGSMRHVHRLFTVDSLAWLEYHGKPSAVPAWVLSLLMLRTVFEGLQLFGWECQDVWARVGAAGKRLCPGDEPSGSEAVRARIRQTWERPDLSRGALVEDVRRLVDRHAEQARPLLGRWRAEYFDDERARLGPRQAAAYYTVFHWNRGALGIPRQALIAESLAEVEGYAAFGADRPPWRKQGKRDRR